MKSTAALVVCAALLAGASLADPRPEPMPAWYDMPTEAVTLPGGAPPLPNFNALNASFFASPVPNILNISSTFGPRFKIGDSRDDFHRGIDYSGVTGEDITCAIDGATVYEIYPLGSSSFSGGGNVVLLQHDLFPAAAAATFHGRSTDVVFSYYMHLDTIDPSIVNATRGQPVALGQRLGGMGMTGAAVSVHLHFETRLCGRCSYQYQFERGRADDPAASSTCYTGFDPHVHPYLFVGGLNDGPKNISRIEPLNATYLAAVRYCTTRGHLDLDTIETKLGTINYDLRQGWNISTDERMDDLSHMTPWLTLRPLPFVRSSDTWCVEFHFRGQECPGYVAVYDIHGNGIRADFPEGCGTSSAAKGALSQSRTSSRRQSPSRSDSWSASESATRVTPLTVSDSLSDSATARLASPTHAPTLTPPRHVATSTATATADRPLPPPPPPLPPRASATRSPNLMHSASATPAARSDAMAASASATRSRSRVATVTPAVSATRTYHRWHGPWPPPPAPRTGGAAADIDAAAVAETAGVVLGIFLALILLVVIVIAVVLRLRNLTWRQAYANVVHRDPTKYTVEFDHDHDAELELLGNQRAEGDDALAPSDAATGGGSSHAGPPSEREPTPAPAAHTDTEDL